MAVPSAHLSSLTISGNQNSLHYLYKTPTNVISLNSNLHTVVRLIKRSEAGTHFVFDRSPQTIPNRTLTFYLPPTNNIPNSTSAIGTPDNDMLGAEYRFTDVRKQASFASSTDIRVNILSTFYAGLEGYPLSTIWTSGSSQTRNNILVQGANPKPDTKKIYSGIVGKLFCADRQDVWRGDGYTTQENFPTGPLDPSEAGINNFYSATSLPYYDLLFPTTIFWIPTCLPAAPEAGAVPNLSTSALTSAKYGLVAAGVSMLSGSDTPSANGFASAAVGGTTLTFLCVRPGVTNTTILPSDLLDFPPPTGRKGSSLASSVGTVNWVVSGESSRGWNLTVLGAVPPALGPSWDQNAGRPFEDLH